jgi:excinuclease ABC subunit A
MERIGLGYLKLGQPTNTLSGGETQRLKLATFLMGPEHGPTAFVFDEPSTGLHGKDIRVLLAVFEKLLTSGHTILAVEHNPQIIAAANWIVELGPEGGDRGGKLLRSSATSAL